MSEFKLHCAIVDYVQLAKRPEVICFHPASGEHRSKITGARLKRMGVSRGIPDLVFVLSGGRVAFMEIKFGSGRLTKEQREFRDRCSAIGARHAVVRSLDEAMVVLIAWDVVRLVGGSRRAIESSPGAAAPAQ